MTTSKYICLLLTLTAATLYAQPQTTYPVVGQPCPDFTLYNLEDAPQKTVTKASLQGKNFILYFWSNMCSACPESFPKTNDLQKKFGDKLPIFLVGDEDKRGRMRPIYQQMRKVFNLRIPHTFDSVLYKKFVHKTVPHLVWVDTNGTVQAITHGRGLDEANFEKFINGETFSHKDVSYASASLRLQTQVAEEQKLNAGRDQRLLYRSEWSLFDPEKGHAGIYENVYRALQNEKRLSGCAPLSRWYKLAYFGHAYLTDEDSAYTVYYPHIEYQLQDSSDFATDSFGTGLYCYNLDLPHDKINPAYARDRLKADLAITFGYTAHVETREMPYWRLEATPKARKELKSKSNDQTSDRWEPTDKKHTNIPVKTMISNVFYKHIEDNPPIVDHTGIEGNIDIHVQGNLYDWEELRKILNQKGLSLVPGKMPMKVLIISREKNKL